MAVVGPHPEEEALGKAYDARLMRRLIRYLRPYRWQVALTIFVLMLASAMAIVGPWLTQLIIDEAIPQDDGRYLALLAAGFMASVVIGVVLQYAQEVITTWLGQSVMYDLRSEIFEKLQRVDLRYYDKNPVGRLTNRRRRTSLHSSAALRRRAALRGRSRRLRPAALKESMWWSSTGSAFWPTSTRLRPSRTSAEASTPRGFIRFLSQPQWLYRSCLAPTTKMHLPLLA